MKAFAPLFLCCLLLSACRSELPPIQECVITTFSDKGEAAARMELAPAQLKPLSAWFAALGDDWTFKITDHYPSGLMLRLTHRGGRVTYANLRGDELWVRNQFKLLTSAERQTLVTILADRHQLPLFDRK